MSFYINVCQVRCELTSLCAKMCLSKFEIHGGLHWCWFKESADPRCGVPGHLRAVKPFPQNYRINHPREATFGRGRVAHNEVTMATSHLAFVYGALAVFPQKMSFDKK